MKININKDKVKKFFNEYFLMIGITAAVLITVAVMLVVDVMPKPPNEDPIDPSEAQQELYGNVPKLVAINLDYCPICMTYRESLKKIKEEYWGRVDVQILEQSDPETEKYSDLLDVPSGDTPQYFLVDEYGEVIDSSYGEFDPEATRQMLNQTLGFDENSITN